MWDTAGQERFHALGPLYYRDAGKDGRGDVFAPARLLTVVAVPSADGALLVYDITDEASFTRVKDWVKELRKMLSDELCIAIAGNKCDMEKSRFVGRTSCARDPPVWTTSRSQARGQGRGAPLLRERRCDAPPHVGQDRRWGQRGLHRAHEK